MSAAVKAVSDSYVMVWRNLTNVRRVPGWFLAATLQPTIFVLMLTMVFGAALGGTRDGASYREFLTPGIFVQIMAVNSAFTIIGFADDLQKGIIDRLRALPMSRIAVLLGRTTSDLATSLLALIVMSICGLIVGWRIRGNIVDALAAYSILLMFAFAMSWIGALIGLVARNVEVAQSVGVMWIFPVSYVSSVFVAQQNLPNFLQPIANWNPFSSVTNASRDLFGNHFGPPSIGWPAQHATLYAVICCIGMIAVFAPLAVARYRRVATK